MTSAQQEAKSVGLPLTKVIDMTGQSLQTLSDLHKDNHKLFRIILLGCKVELTIYGRGVSSPYKVWCHELLAAR